MRELAKWGYISYDPATRHFMPGLVTMYRFDGVKNVRDPDGVYARKGSVSGVTQGAMGVIPDDTPDSTRHDVLGTINSTPRDTPDDTLRSTDNINYINNTNNQNKLNAYEQASPTSNHSNDFTHPVQTSDGKEKSNVRGGGRDAIPAGLDDVYPFFVSLQSTRIEAEKFFHYFTSNGWKVGGRSPMVDWRASARNWVLNALRFNTSNGPTPGSLSSPGPQNHAEPL